MNTSLSIGLSVFLIVVTTQNFPMEYKMDFKYNAPFGPVYQVKHLTLNEDSTYIYHYSQSISKKEYLKSQYDVQKTERGKWLVNDDRLILKSLEGTSWQLIVDSRWNLYFLGLNNRKGSKFKKNR